MKLPIFAISAFAMSLSACSTTSGTIEDASETATGTVGTVGEAAATATNTTDSNSTTEDASDNSATATGTVGTVGEAAATDTNTTDSNSTTEVASDKSATATGTVGTIGKNANSTTDSNMSFFITSINPGNGGDLGGLAGADAYCDTLAQAAGVEGKTWHAYLSTSDVNARDRIGSGPWTDATGVVVATSVDNLLSENNNLTKQSALDENGQIVNGRGDTPNRHDIMTGSDASGNATDATCENWTSSSEGAATVGHHDRTGGGDDPTSWSSAHDSRGCSLEDLRGTGGDGLYYCFAE